ncbi:MAG TPA: hypothetical protein VFW21_11775, partial [Mycobacterium sp.]|nr:hypothetical protein [Mycobacterium sp.]
MQGLQAQAQVPVRAEQARRPQWWMLRAREAPGVGPLLAPEQVVVPLAARPSRTVRASPVARVQPCATTQVQRAVLPLRMRLVPVRVVVPVAVPLARVVVRAESFPTLPVAAGVPVLAVAVVRALVVLVAVAPLVRAALVVVRAEL